MINMWTEHPYNIDSQTISTESDRYETLSRDKLSDNLCGARH